MKMLLNQFLEYIEQSDIPRAVYVFRDGKVIPLTVSNGLIEFYNNILRE